MSVFYSYYLFICCFTCALYVLFTFHVFVFVRCVLHGCCAAVLLCSLRVFVFAIELYSCVFS